MNKKLFLSSLLSTLLLQNIAFADDSFDMDLDGFDSEEMIDSEEDIQESVDEVQKSSPLTVGGDIAFKTAYGYKKHKVDGVEYGGFNQAQISLSVNVEYKISDSWKLKVDADTYYDSVYALRTKTDFNDDVLESYETDIMIKDAYIEGSLTNSLDLKLGRQIVVWGKSDSIRITDVINPLDNRTPGMTDIEDLRLSVGMAKFDYYVGNWNISGMIIAENRVMIESAPRGEFFPVDTLFPSAKGEPFKELDTPSSSLENIEYALAFNGVFSGWDLSFYGADVLDQRWHINQVTKTREVSTIQMLGSAVNIATGSWLLKSEVAFLSGINYNQVTDEKNRLDMLIGFDYMGIKDTVLSLEVADRHIFDYENKINSEKDDIQTAVRITRSFSNDSIQLTVLRTMFGSSFKEGGFVRVWSEIDIMDGVTSNIGVVDYIGGDNIFMEAVKDNDRIFADISYSF